MRECDVWWKIIVVVVVASANVACSYTPTQNNSQTQTISREKNQTNAGNAKQPTKKTSPEEKTPGRIRNMNNKH